MADADPAARRTAQVARAGAIVSVSMLLSRLLGMSRDSVMAAKFAIGAHSDAYSIAVQIPDLIFMLIAGGGLSSAFMPAFSDFWHKGRKAEAWRMFSVVVTISFLVVSVLSALAWIFTPWIVGLFGKAKTPEMVQEAVGITRILWPAQIAFIVGSVLQATLYARKRFLAPALAPNVYNLGIILGALLLGGTLGISGMAWGGVVGAMLGALVIPAVAVALSGGRFTPSLDVNAPGVKSFFRLLLPVILGFSLPSVVGILTQYFASEFPEVGVNTILRNANNLMQAPLGFFGQALALAVFPVLAEYVAKGDMPRYRAQVAQTLRTVVYLGAMSGALMLALAPQISHLLYGWGQAAHQPGALDGIAACLRVYALAIPLWCMQPVLMRGFFSLHKTLKPMLIGTGVTALFIALCYAAVAARLSYLAVPWATNVAAAALAVVLYFGLESDVGRLPRRALGATLVRSGIAAVVGGAVAYAGSLLSPTSHGRLLDLASLLFFGLIGFWAFFWMSKKMNMPESAYLDRMLTKAGSRFARRT